MIACRKRLLFIEETAMNLIKLISIIIQITGREKDERARERDTIRVIENKMDEGWMEIDKS
jgi:hypothetical protein